MSAQITHELALVIVASQRALADIKGIKADLNGAGFTPDEISDHLADAISKARDINLERRHSQRGTASHFVRRMA